MIIEFQAILCLMLKNGWEQQNIPKFEWSTTIQAKQSQ